MRSNFFTFKATYVAIVFAAVAFIFFSQSDKMLGFFETKTVQHTVANELVDLRTSQIGGIGDQELYYISAGCGAFCPEDCDCYWSSECSSGESCDYSSGCTHKGKKDGTCSSSCTVSLPSGSGAALGDIFDAYIATAAANQDGMPDIAAINLSMGHGLSDEEYLVLQRTVFNALDVTIGFDYYHPPEKCNEPGNSRCWGQFRIGQDEAATDLIEAAKLAVVTGLSAGNSGGVAAEMQAFWNANPNYEPHHTGRCYDHGHGSNPYGSALDCHVVELELIVDHLNSCP